MAQNTTINTQFTSLSTQWQVKCAYSAIKSDS